jgi:amino acid adenylation domain-containing protein
MTASLRSAEAAGEQGAISAEMFFPSLPLSFAQQRLWRQCQPHSALNLQAVFLLEGSITIECLQQAFGELLKRHEMLRARIRIDADNSAQVIGGPDGFRIDVVDLSSLDNVQRMARTAALTQSEREHQFDLANGPLLRASLLCDGANLYHLIVTVHCLLCDAGSLEILMRDLAEFYAASVEGRAPELPSIVTQYSEHVLSQREWMQSESAQDQMEYWKSQLAGNPRRLDLPTDYPRLSVIRSGHTALPFSLSYDLSAALSKLAEQEGVTLFVLLLSAFHLLLSRYSGQKDVLVGTQVAGRSWGKTGNTIGLFENPIVLRADLSDDPSFIEFLYRIKDVVAVAQQNDSIPFEKLVTVLQPEGDADPLSLFQAMSTLRIMPQPLETPCLRVSILEITQPITIADQDLSLEFCLQPSGLNGRLSYAKELFVLKTIASLQNHFSTLLENICAYPNHCLSQLTLLDKAERHQLLTQWNETAVALPDKCIHELVSEQALLTPGAVAILDETRHLTYGEVEARSNRLAQYLRSLGVGPEVVVGLCVQRSLEMMIGLLGILKAGGAYLPLDTSYPRDRLENMIQDSQIEYIVATSNVAGMFPSYTRRWVLIDNLWNGEQIDPIPDRSVKSHVLPENLAHVIYTSGSTGRPKGVAVTHRSVVALLTWAKRYFSAEYARTALCATSISFDPSILELFLPLICGGRAFVVESLLDLGRASVKHEISMIVAAPSAMPALLEQGAIGDNVKLVVLGSEKLQHSVVHLLKTRTKIERLQNVYGPTESTLFCTTIAVEPREEMDPFLGRPISNTQVYILDQHYDPVPINIAGEIYISGKGLARGYYGRPELTAERFLPNPFRAGERMYATGDLARYREAMEIEFLGRKDQQVKIRGFRVELGEIEALLNELPAIRSAVVSAWEISPGQNQLAAYLVPWKDQTLELQDVKNHLGKRLPPYMMPAVFMVLESLPTTASGKVDRGKLPKSERPKDVAEASLAAQEMTASQNKIAAVWQEVLRVDSIGLEQDFFELGGQSLLALIASAKLSETFSQAISIKDHYTYRTVRQMADAVEQGNLTGEAVVRETET